MIAFPSTVMVCEAMPLALDAAQVILSVSLGSRMPFFGAAASATTTLVMLGGTGVPATTVNVPELSKLTPSASVELIE